MRTKAYGVTNQECLGCIVFAPDRSSAIRWARKYESDCFAYCEYHEIQCRRIPSIDHMQQHEGIVPWNRKRESMEIYRTAGWFPEDAGCRFCDCCGLYEFEELPESMLDEDDICRECQEAP